MSVRSNRFKAHPKTPHELRSPPLASCSYHRPQSWRSDLHLLLLVPNGLRERERERKRGGLRTTSCERYFEGNSGVFLCLEIGGSDSHFFNAFHWGLRSEMIFCENEMREMRKVGKVGSHGWVGWVVY